MSAPDLLDQVPNTLGAYALAIRLTRPLGLRLPRRRELILPAGRYVYCGSAYGPGGLRARIGRHMRTQKPIRWHVDQLSRAGDITAVKAVPGGRECALLAAILAIPGSSVPVPGFGSTDCRRCPAHLAAVPDDFDLCATAL